MSEDSVVEALAQHLNERTEEWRVQRGDQMFGARSWGQRTAADREWFREIARLSLSFANGPTALAAAKDAVVEAAVERREHASSENLNLLIDALDVYLKLKEGDA